jgi:hypothetical protein
MTLLAVVSLAAGQAGGLLRIATSSAASASGSCTFPSQPAPTPEQTAWEIFVAANCPAPGGKLVWQTWIEQQQLYSVNPRLAALPPRLHGSILGAALAGTLTPGKPVLPQLNTGNQCNPMVNPPSNVVKPPEVPVVCEEVRINKAAEDFIRDNNYDLKRGQITAAQKDANIQFPSDAVEVKADWIPVTDFTAKPPFPFTCSGASPSFYVKMFEYQKRDLCFALVGMHIESKLYQPNWLWATFEPQSKLTNPFRCVFFGPCVDFWGSSPAISVGTKTKTKTIPGPPTHQTPALAALMKSAGLAAAFDNYRLDGTETDFFDQHGKPNVLGNSVVEYEAAGVPAGQASCITCHSISSMSNQGVDSISFFNFLPQVGPEYNVPLGSVRRDFVWSMVCAGGACGKP